MILKYAMSWAFAGMMSMGLLVSGPARADADDTKYDLGMIPAPHIMRPQGKVSSEVVLISDLAGWSDKEKAVADKLVANGALVIGIDYPSFLASLNKYDVSQNDGCIYIVADLESLSQQVQRSFADSTYQLPIIAGVGAGGAMALTIAAQTPDATVAGTLAVDPAAGIGLKQELCTPADKKTDGDMVSFGLQDGTLPNPILVTFTPNAPKDGRERVEELQKDHPDVQSTDSDNTDTYATLEASLAIARRLGLPWGGGQSLYDAETNIVLGSAYLRQLMDRYGGKPYQVMAGYNAGPAPLNRWMSQRPAMDPDFWIETISYKETREYVARVLSFSTVYDWRLNGDALRLSDRLLGRTGGPRKQFACPVAEAPRPAPPPADTPAPKQRRSR